MKVEKVNDKWVVWYENDKVVRFVFDSEQDALTFVHIEQERMAQERLLYEV